MRFPLAAASILIWAAPAAGAKPPRQESPAPPALVAAPAPPADAELDATIAAAGRHPLGSLENPVRTAGPDGAQAYLARLRCSDGSRPRLSAPRPAGVDTYGSLVDLYPVDCGTAAPGRADLVVDIYQEEHVETGAPAGFRIEPR